MGEEPTLTTFVATDSLRRLLDEINGMVQLSPRLPTLSPTISEMVRVLTDRFAPVVLVGVEATGTMARARVHSRDGQLRLITLRVDADPPHEPIELSCTELVPQSLPPRMPMDFTHHPQPLCSSGNTFILFSGLPGTGKSTLAEAIGRELGVPVFNADWLLGALTPFGGYHLDGRQVVGAELLTTLAFRQLYLGQSVILDFPTESDWIRRRWRSLASHAGLTLKVVVCLCPDAETHRQRLHQRRRGIPGWHEGGNWPSIKARRMLFRPWQDDALIIDTTRPHEHNMELVLRFLAEPTLGTP